MHSKSGRKYPLILKQPTKRTEELLRWFNSIPIYYINSIHDILGFSNYTLNEELDIQLLSSVE
jgi:hypothetical protein